MLELEEGNRDLGAYWPYARKKRSTSQLQLAGGYLAPQVRLRYIKSISLFNFDAFCSSLVYYYRGMQPAIEMLSRKKLRLGYKKNGKINGAQMWRQY